MVISSENLHKALKSYFGFDGFKGLQESVVNSIISKINTFAIMPTGGGKSLCYQLPALMQEGTAIVVSPLIALMKNQVDAIRGVSESEGVAHVLNSSLNKTEIKQVKSDIKNGITKLLYVAPESLSKADNIEFLKIPLSTIGILYLLYLAYDSFQSSNLKNEKIELNNKYDQNALLSGVILSITNPQNIFYWAALGSAFGALGVKEPTTYHYFIFFLGFISSSIIWCFICALAVEKIFRFK